MVPPPCPTTPVSNTKSHDSEFVDRFHVNSLSIHASSLDLGESLENEHLKSMWAVVDVQFMCFEIRKHSISALPREIMFICLIFICLIPRVHNTHSCTEDLDYMTL